MTDYKLVPVERIAAFIAEWKNRAGNGENIYCLGMMDGTLDLTVSDLEAMLSSAPEPVSDPYKLGWIVSNANGDQWRAWEHGFTFWTPDRDKATRYARREDAEVVHAEDDDAWRVTPYSAQPLSNTQELEGGGYWFDPIDPEITDSNPDNILCHHYAKWDVVELGYGDLTMFGFWFEPSDGADFQYRYFTDRDQADAECLAGQAAMKAENTPPVVGMPNLTPQSAIAIIAKLASDFGWSAGESSSEIAGGFVSYLAANPDQIYSFLRGPSDEQMMAAIRSENGCLTWRGMNGQIMDRDSYAEALAQIKGGA